MERAFVVVLMTEQTAHVLSLSQLMGENPTRTELGHPAPTPLPYPSWVGSAGSSVRVWEQSGGEGSSTVEAQKEEMG